MALMDYIRNAVRGQLGQPPVQSDRSFGEPGKVLVDRFDDHEVASRDIANDLNAAYPSGFNAHLRSGFDPRRDYDGLLAKAAHAMSAELERTWEVGKPYSSWVSEAARHAGI